jgi:hypothetical protein
MFRRAISDLWERPVYIDGYVDFLAVVFLEDLTLRPAEGKD